MNQSSTSTLLHAIVGRQVWRIALAIGATFGATSSLACEFSAQTLTVVHPWTRASEVGATSAIVGLSFQDVREDDRLIAMESPIAEGAEMVGPGLERSLSLAIPAGSTSVLGEHGVQLRLTGLKEPLRVGREYPLILVFEKAGRVQARLSVDYARFR